jgi:hypothetical protein
VKQYFHCLNGVVDVVGVDVVAGVIRVDVTDEVWVSSLALHLFVLASHADPGAQSRYLVPQSCPGPTNMAHVPSLMHAIPVWQGSLSSPHF